MQITEINLSQCTNSEKVRLDDCERKLDLTSIVIIRQKIELETEKLQELQRTDSKAWYSGWWGGSKSSKSSLADMEKSTNLRKFDCTGNYLSKSVFYSSKAI